MLEKTLREKIGWRPRQRVLLIGRPAGVEDPFEGVEHLRVRVGESLMHGLTFDLMLAFVADRAALHVVAPILLQAAIESTVVWIAYPKRSSGLKTDLTRDDGWDPMIQERWMVVAIVSVNETWSAVRFRPVHLVKTTR